MYDLTLSNPTIEAMDRATLKATLPKWVQYIPMLLAFLVKYLPLILPLLAANRTAFEAGLTYGSPGDPVPDGTDPITRVAIDAGRAERG